MVIMWHSWFMFSLWPIWCLGSFHYQWCLIICFLSCIYGSWLFLLSVELVICPYWSAFFLTILFLQLAVIMLDSKPGLYHACKYFQPVVDGKFHAYSSLLIKIEKKILKKLNWSQYRTALKQIFILQGKSLFNHNFPISWALSRHSVLTMFP